MRTIIDRIQALEKKCTNPLPVVIAVYHNGERVTYKGCPPLEHFEGNNRIVETSGSEFADMLNVVLHPMADRDISDFERGGRNEEK